MHGGVIVAAKERPTDRQRHDPDIGRVIKNLYIRYVNSAQGIELD